MTRRDALIAGMLVTSGGLAIWVKPSSVLEHSSPVDLHEVLAKPIVDAPQTEAKEVILASTEDLGGELYDQLAVARYRPPSSGDVTVLLAHGSAQSQASQLHRPEYCYPASGFDILSQTTLEVAFADWRIPVTVVVAKRGQRIDTVAYWTRVGNEFPTGLWDQRFIAARRAIMGSPVDGLLARFSLSSITNAAPQADLLSFIARFCGAQDSATLEFLLGEITRR